MNTYRGNLWRISKYQFYISIPNESPQGRAMARPCGLWLLVSHAVMRRRVAQGTAEKEAKMFEPAGRVSESPAGPEQRSVPAQPGDESGSPFFPFPFFGEVYGPET
jgi:hypothetical protein